MPNKKREKPQRQPHKGLFVPSDDERKLVKLLVAAGYAQHHICDLISNKRGSTISESTLKAAFEEEIRIAKIEADGFVLGKLMNAIKNEQPWAIQLWLHQRMWQPDRGGWRIKQQVEIGSPSGGSGLGPITLVAQFQEADPDMKPRF